MHVITKSIITEISTSYNWCKMQQNNHHGDCNNNNNNENNILCNKLVDNFKNILQFFKSNGGRWSNVSEQFVRTMFTGFSSPNILSQFTDETIESVFGLSSRSIKRRFELGSIYRELIATGNEKAFQIVVKGQRKLQIDLNMRQKKIH